MRKADPGGGRRPRSSPHSAVPAARSEVPFPTGYRMAGPTSKRLGHGAPAFPQFAGLHHIYANKAAMTLPQDCFPVGSVMVFDVSTPSPPGSFVPPSAVSRCDGKGRRRLALQRVQGRQPYRRAQRDHRAAMKECAACHERAKQDHVFSPSPRRTTTERRSRPRSASRLVFGYRVAGSMVIIFSPASWRSRLPLAFPPPPPH